MRSPMAKVVDFLRVEIELWRGPAAGAGHTLDDAFAEARRRFPADRFQQEVDALVELQRRDLRGDRRHDA